MGYNNNSYMAEQIVKSTLGNVVYMVVSMFVYLCIKSSLTGTVKDL